MPRRGNRGEHKEALIQGCFRREKPINPSLFLRKPDLISVSLGKVADDPTVLEFGVFEDGRMTAAVGCGIDAAHGFRINNSAVIRFAPGAEREELYRPVFMGVTDLLLGMGLVPFDDIHNG